MIVKVFDSYLDAANFLRNNKPLVFNETLTVIDNCILNDEDVAIICKFHVLNDLIVIKISRDNWHVHLNVSLEFYESIEDYEMCIRIRNLLKSI